MTGENCRLNVLLELEKAEVSLQEVEVLMERSLWDAAISRAYYGIFHLARALLFSMGLEARSHGGVIHLLSMHLVRTGAFPGEMVRALSRMQKLREDADYQTTLHFDQEAAEESKNTFTRFKNTAESYLIKEGFFPGE